jgi:hypothetical protein
LTVKEHIDPPAIVRPAEELAALAGRINREHAAGEEAALRGLEHFRKAGEALLKAKAWCGHGGWLPWLKANVVVSKTQAYRYMALAKIPVTGNLEEQWRAISGNAPAGDEEEPDEASPAPGVQTRGLVVYAVVEPSELPKTISVPVHQGPTTTVPTGHCTIGASKPGQQKQRQVDYDECDLLRDASTAKDFAGWLAEDVARFDTALVARVPRKMPLLKALNDVREARAKAQQAVARLGVIQCQLEAALKCGERGKKRKGGGL